MLYVVTLFSLVGTIAFYRYFFKTESKLRVRLENAGTFKKWLVLLAFPVMAYSTIGLAILAGLPALLHKAGAQDGALSFKIVSKSSLYHTKHCNGGVKIDYPVFIFHERYNLRPSQRGLAKY